MGLIRFSTYQAETFGSCHNRGDYYDLNSAYQANHGDWTTESEQGFSREAKFIVSLNT